MVPLLISAVLAATPLQPVKYPSGSDTVSGLLATPAANGRHPAIIVVHEYWGLNDFAKAKTSAIDRKSVV